MSNHYTLDAIQQLFELPFPELMFQAQSVHRQHFDPKQVQISTLISIKTGRCPEDCGYCPQSGHYNTGLAKEPLLDTDDHLGLCQSSKSQWRITVLHGRSLAQPA